MSDVPHGNTQRKSFSSGKQSKLSGQLLLGG